MKTILANNYGFCFGVKRAVKITINEKNKKNVYTFGELLHNPQFLKRLKSYNIKQINSLDDINSGTIILRAHGVTLKTIKKAHNKNFKIIDATCPKVKKIHILAKNLSDKDCKVIILGDKSHPEVKGIASYARNPIIINSKKEARSLKSQKKIGFISQTTQQVSKFNEIKKILKLKTNNFICHNTICDATQKRQNSTEKLAKKVDIMIVIGGKRSSNTQKLATISKKYISTYHIESSNELRQIWFKNKNICGITAGASTPKWIILDVIKHINKY